MTLTLVMRVPYIYDSIREIHGISMTTMATDAPAPGRRRAISDYNGVTCPVWQISWKVCQSSSRFFETSSKSNDIPKDRVLFSYHIQRVSMLRVLIRLLPSF